MANFDQEEFNGFVLEEGILGLFEKDKVLKSKRTSKWYVNWRLNDAFKLERVGKFVVALAKDIGLEPDMFYGVPEGATRLGLLAQLAWAKQSGNYGPGTHILPMGRGKTKDHGDAKNKYFVAAPSGKVVVVEDVTTTGTSLLNTIANLKELDGVEVIAALGLTNRMEITPIPGKDDAKVVAEFARNYERATGQAYENPGSVEEVINATGARYHALSESTVLLPRMFASQPPGEEIITAIKAEFEEYGIAPLEREGE